MSDEANLYEEVFGDAGESDADARGLLRSAGEAARGLERLVAEGEGDGAAGSRGGSPGPGEEEPLWTDEDDEVHAAEVLKARQRAPAAWVREALERRPEDEGEPSQSEEEEPATKRGFRRPLKPGVLEFVPLPDLTAEDTPLQGVEAVQVHPGGQVALVLAGDSRARFFQLAGEACPLLQSLLFDKFSASSAFFLERGQKVVVTGNRPEYFLLDLAEGTQETHSLRASAGTRVDSMQRAVPLIDVCGAASFPGGEEASELAGGVVVFSQCGRLGNLRMTEQERARLREDRAALELARQQGPEAAADMAAQLRRRPRPLSQTGSVFLLDTRTNTVLQELHTPFSDTRVLAMCAEWLLVSGEDAGGRVMLYEVRVSRGGTGGSPAGLAGPGGPAAAGGAEGAKGAEGRAGAPSLDGIDDLDGPGGLGALPDISARPGLMLSDIGAMRVTCIAGCGEARLFAVGQDSGVVDIYSLDAVLSQLSARRRPAPRFTIKNIREAITAMRFNHTGEILAISDGKKETRFVHVSSGTVFNISRNPRNVRCFCFAPDSSAVYLGTGWGRVQALGLPHYR